MSERMKLVLFVVGILLVFTVVSLLVRAATEFDEIRDHASTRTNPWGTKAWREVLEASGVATATWGRPLTELTDEVPMLVLIDPTERVEGPEAAAVAEWVSEGGRLVVAPFAYRDSSGMGGGAAHAGMERVLHQFGVHPTTGGAAEAVATPAVEDTLTADVDEIAVPTDGRLDVLQPGAQTDGERPNVLLRDPAGRPVAVSVSHGDGTVVVLAEAEILANATLPRADNVVFAANLVFAGGAPGEVYFDEFHHGFAEAESVFGGPQVDVSAFRNTALALLAVVVIYAVGRARRFGAPTEVEAASRRSAADYVRALAQVHGRAGDASIAASMLAAGLRRRAAAAAHVPAGTDRTSLAGALTSRGLPGDDIAELIARLEDADRSMTDAQLLTLAQHVAHYERML